MKTFIIAVLFFSNIVFASPCSNFNGTFSDGVAKKIMLKSSSDCKTVAVEDGESTFFIAGEKERKYDQVLIRATFPKQNTLQIDYHLAGTGLINRAVYEISIDNVIKMVETDYSLQPNGTKTTEQIKVFYSIH